MPDKQKIRKLKEESRKKYEESEKKNMELRIRAEKSESYRREIEHLRDTQRKLTEANMSELQINTDLEIRQRKIQLLRQPFKDKMDEQHLRNEEREYIVKDNKDQKPFEIEVHGTFRGIRSLDGNLQGATEEDKEHGTINSQKPEAYDTSKGAMNRPEGDSDILYSPKPGSGNKKLYGYRHRQSGIVSYDDGLLDKFYGYGRGEDKEPRIWKNLKTRWPDPYDVAREYDYKDVENEYRIVLIGKTGAGKSATGNSLISREEFNATSASRSSTKQCKKAESNRGDKRLIVVDTPGIFDTDTPNEETGVEILKCIGISAPGPHAVVLVVQIGRFTEEEQASANQLINILGDAVYDFLIILFTRIEDLDKGTTLEDHVHSVPNYLKSILEKCGNRYVGFNNKALGQQMEKQMDLFFDKLDDMRRVNEKPHYTNMIYKAAEQIYVTAIQNTMREAKDEILRIQKKLQSDFDIQEKEIEDLKEKVKELENVTPKRIRETERENVIKGDGDTWKKIKKSTKRILKKLADGAVQQMGSALVRVFLSLL